MRIRRSRSLQIETLEGKILLSSGTADPAKSLGVTAAKPFAFNATLYVGFAERSSASSNESEFYAFNGKDKEPFKPMGTHVQMAGPLAHPQLLPTHAFPDLSDSTLSLANSKGVCRSPFPHRSQMPIILLMFMLSRSQQGPGGL